METFPLESRGAFRLPAVMPQPPISFVNEFLDALAREDGDPDFLQKKDLTDDKVNEMVKEILREARDCHPPGINDDVDDVPVDVVHAILWDNTSIPFPQFQDLDLKRQDALDRGRPLYVIPYKKALQISPQGSPKRSVSGSRGNDAFLSIDANADPFHNMLTQSSKGTGVEFNFMQSSTPRGNAPTSQGQTPRPAPSPPAIGSTIEEEVRSPKG